MSDESPLDPRIDAPPVQLGRYRLLERLGEGGMGTVYLAVDGDLGRRVAIKWLKHTHSGALDRLRQEARLQAQVEHPAICRLYGIEDHEGWPYLVMQYVHGKTFDCVAPELDLRTKIRLMADIADGVQAAHRLGLVHRDLKPTNLMVELDEAGAWRAYIMDFGLAKDAACEGQTKIGTFVGSPAYMAPEQIGGHWVDLRADIYGLGASLFEFLTGRPPYLGGTLSEVLAQVQSQDPPLLREIRPELSKDLERLLCTCLARDPAHRYQSAATLRDDLHRILDGEPIIAQRPPLLRLGAQWIRKHPLVSGLATTLLASSLVTGGIWMYYRQRSRVQTYWAQRFGQDVMRMDNILRFGHMLPSHDLSAEFDQVRRSMEEVRALMSQDRQRLGPGHLAMGEAYLLLGQSEPARRELESAWNSGFRPPELSMALGRCFLNLYQDANQGSLNAEDQKQRMDRQAELRKEFLTPALTHFQRVRQMLGTLPKMEAILSAMAEDRYEEAAALAKSLHQSEPWRYETLWHEALSLTFQGKQEIDQGQIEKARTAFEAALEILDKAKRITPSDDRIFDTQADIWKWGYFLNLKGLDQKASLERALAASEQSLILNTHLPHRCIKKGNILAWMGKAANDRGEDSDLLFQQAETAIRKGLEIPEQGLDALQRKSRANAYDQILNLQVLRANQSGVEADQLRPILESGLHIYAKACAEGLAQASIHKWGGVLFAVQSGQYPHDSPDYLQSNEKALKAWMKSAELEPKFGSYDNIIELLNRMAMWKVAHKQDPATCIAQARTVLRQLQTFSPDNAEYYLAAGNISWVEAACSYSQHQDCIPFLDDAQSNFEKALATYQKKRFREARIFEIHGRLSEVHVGKAEALQAKGEDPRKEAKLGIHYAQLTMNDAPRWNEYQIYARQHIADAKTILQQFGNAR